MNERDVRMRGFQRRVRLQTVLDWLSAHLAGRTPATCRVALGDSHGRVVAEEIAATRNVPPFRRSAMDGYALKGEETTGASDYSPLPFRIVGESWPGQPFEGIVSTGQAVKIMTGAPVPEGADAVIPAEYTREQQPSVEITGSVPPHKNVGKVGEDLKAGQVVFQSGRRLRPQDVGLLAALGMAEVPVVRRPGVRILITGNELASVGTEAEEHQIYDSNSWMLRSLVERDSGELCECLMIADRRDAIVEAMTKPGADVILVSGGSSVGAEDYAPTVLDEHGELRYHGISMRPASPTGAGTVGNTLVFLLPGNPVSCLCAYDLLAGIAIRNLAGLPGVLPYRTVMHRVSKKIVSAVGRMDYCRVGLDENGVFPLAISGASILSSTCRAAGFVLVPEESEGYAVGHTVEVFLYDTFTSV